MMSKVKLPIDRLTIGLYIQLPCSWNQHPFLFSSFKIQDQKQISLLQSLALTYVIYVPSKSSSEPLSQAKPKIDNAQIEEDTSKYLEQLWQEKNQRVEQQKSYLRNMRECENQFNKSLSILRSVNLKVKNQGPQALRDAKEIVLRISDKLNSSDKAVLHLMEEGQEGDKYHHHVFHVAILAMILGKALNLHQQELIYLGLGALFHDIGKNRLPNQVIQNRPKVTPAENNLYKMHVRYSMEVALKIQDFPEPAKKIIAQHHEYLDGSGYPQRLKGAQINKLTQIVSVANEYANQCSPTDKSPARTPYHALSFLYKTKGEKLNKKILGLLIKELGVYPPGSIVQLNNEMYALVMSVCKENILCPNVMLYDPLIPKSEAVTVSLSEKKLTIDKVINPNKLPEKIRQYLNPRARINYYLGPPQMG